jgi:hypothetical protein
MARGPIALGTARGRSRPLNAARLVNLYAEKAPEGSMSPWILFGTPGMKSWTTHAAMFAGGPIRGGHQRYDHVIILAGQTLYAVYENGTVTALTGAAPPAEGVVTMRDDGVQLALLVGTSMFYATGFNLLPVSDADFPASGATSLDYIDGYAILTANSTTSASPYLGQFFISGLHDFSAYDALDFATAESSPDSLTKVLAHHQEAWLFGQETIEVYTNTGASPFPFERIPGSLINKGIVARDSAVVLDNAPFWVGQDRIVYRAQGYTPSRISTEPVEEILRSGTVSDAIGYTYSQAGHTFYVLRLPTLGRTLVYDAMIGGIDRYAAWHERQSGTGLSPAGWDITCMFEAFGKTLVGTSSGYVYELDLDTYTEAGAPIRSVVTSSPVYPDGKRALLREIELECELGVGLNTGQGSDPQAMLRFSRDGGQTFGNEKWASLGAIGSRRKRAFWTQLGAFRNGVVEISISDPVKRAIYGCNYEAEALSR